MVDLKKGHKAKRNNVLKAALAAAEKRKVKFCLPSEQEIKALDDAFAIITTVRNLVDLVVYMVEDADDDGEDDEVDEIEDQNYFEEDHPLEAQEGLEEYEDDEKKLDMQED